MLLKENNDLKDQISQFKTQLQIKQNEVYKKEKDINELKGEIEKASDLKLKIKQLREKL